MATQTLVLDQDLGREHTEDYQLAIACQSGSSVAFQKLVKMYQEKVRGLIYSILNDASVLDDLTQEVFIKVYTSIDKFEHRSSLGTWIYRITVNHCRDEIRRKRIRRFFSLDKMEWEPKSMGTTTDGLMLQKEKVQMVQWGLSQLPEKHRTIIILKDFEELSYEEIADILKIELGTVKSRLNRARTMLKEVLDPHWSHELEIDESQELPIR